MKASQSPLRHLKLIPTGLPALDGLLDGGVALRRITHFSGISGTGKSTVAAGIVATAQKLGYETLWLDVEHRFAFDYFESLGVDLDKLEYEDPQVAEEVFDRIEAWSKKHDGVIVLDSIGGLLTRKEAERNNGEGGFPEAPKMIPSFVRRMVANLAVRDCALILLNHEKVTFEGAIKTLGGSSVIFHSDNWIRLRRLTNKKIMSGDEMVGAVIEASLQKGKNRFKTCELHLMNHTGFDREKDLLESAIAKGVIDKRGNSYFFENERVAVGMGKLREAMLDEEFSKKVKELV